MAMATILHHLSCHVLKAVHFIIHKDREVCVPQLPLTACIVKKFTWQYAHKLRQFFPGTGFVPRVKDEKVVVDYMRNWVHYFFKYLYRLLCLLQEIHRVCGIGHLCHVFLFFHNVTESKFFRIGKQTISSFSFWNRYWYLAPLFWSADIKATVIIELKCAYHKCHVLPLSKLANLCLGMDLLSMTYSCLSNSTKALIGSCRFIISGSAMTEINSASNTLESFKRWLLYVTCYFHIVRSINSVLFVIKL